MNAIKKVRKYLLANPKSESSRILGDLVAALGEEKPYQLADLYSLDYDTFELAIALLEDWRLDRYYAARLKLFDTAHLEVLKKGSNS
jgi:hypothetical protein